MTPETEPVPVDTPGRRDLHEALARLAPGDPHFPWRVMRDLNPAIDDRDDIAVGNLAAELADLKPGLFVSAAACSRWVRKWESEQ